jgi:DNA repair protein RecN (Recombination protein N)
MIEKLYIKNYLIIKESEIEFSEGLNILTGETGAGKSIILDALSLILGERADYSIIKDDKDKLIVEGYFRFRENRDVDFFLKSNDIQGFDNTVIVRRELQKKGISRNFINDTPVTISVLKEFGEMIIDIHSQNEHQSLLKKENHIGILDEFISERNVFNEYKVKYDEYKKLVNDYQNLIQKKNSIIEKKEFIEFQLREINNVNPKLNEDIETEEILNRLENTENISLALRNSINLLTGNDNNIISGINQVIKEIKKISVYDKSFENDINELGNILILLKEIERNFSEYINNINFDPAYIESLRERSGQLQFLKKKYRLSVNELLEKAKELSDELSQVENFDFEIEKTEKIIEEEKKNLFSLAIRLSELRTAAGEVMKKAIRKQFKDVGLDNADFKVNIQNNKDNTDEFFTANIKGKKISLNNNGIDDIEFLVITNKGEEFQPLRKIASGGEISRLMLSIKSSLSNKDKIPILVFDEIDAGISGRIAEKVGKVLKTLAKSHQLISITHLPQIAAYSENHLSVSKSVINDETVAGIKKLSEKEKIEEIAKLLSGEIISEASIKTAKELISNTKQ